MRFVVSRSRLAQLAVLLLLAGFTASCAYYNTFYLARKYYMKATDGQPYEVDREGSSQRPNYNKSADYSKKVLGVHPRSKWVDDAWLMWARTLIGTDDPLKAVAMLQEFETRFPKSDQRPDAEFYLGLAYRAARKYELAVDRFDNFLAQAPKHVLVPYAWYERSRALLALNRPQDAARSAGQIIEHFSNHVLVDRALRQRAEARYLQKDWKGARDDFRSIGQRALTDDDRFRYLLREVDCLESDRQYEEARAVLRDARSHVPAPPPVPALQRVGTTSAAPGSAPLVQPTTVAVGPGQDKYGRLTIRMGGVELLAGRVKEAVQYFESVIHDYPRTQLAAEAQYRIGYAYETGADDFARARVEYPRVKEQTGTSQFAQQAQQRLENLDRIERFRTASGADSVERKAEARFLTAEHYLYNLDRPERALVEYRAISDSSTSRSAVARALNAQAWVMSRKLSQRSAGDSLFWKVVREYPATEAQLAARDYLEADGHTVPSELIVPPKEPVKPLLDLGDSLTRPPRHTPQLGTSQLPLTDPTRLGPGSRAGALADSMRRIRAARDTLLAAAMRDTSAAGRARVDSLRRVFSRPDTTGRGAMMAEIERRLPKPDSVMIAPEGSPPVLGAEPGAARVTLPSPSAATHTLLPDDRGVEQPPPASSLAGGDSLNRLLPDSSRAVRAGSDTLRRLLPDSSRAERARSATMDWVTGATSMTPRPFSEPLPARISPRVRTDTAGVRHALVPDSLRKLSTAAGAGTAPPAGSPESGAVAVPADGDAVTPEAAPAPPAAPEKPASRSITSWERHKKDPLERARERDAKRRAKAVRDSLKHVKSHPPAQLQPAAPDTAALGKARQDSLARVVPPPVARPDTLKSARPDTTSGRER